MAVPFIVPEDQNEVEVIIIQLQSLLTKLQAALRRSRGGTPPPGISSTTRIRTGASGSNRARTQDQSTSTTSTVPSANIPELLNNLAWLAVVSQEAVQPSPPGRTPQLTANATLRSSRRRTSSESSCCEESKVSITTVVNHNDIQDWNQELDGPGISSAKSHSDESIFSKFVPGPVSAPLWTAMICFVGWHLFRAR